MGAFCCCPCGEELDEYSHPSNSIYRHCICLRYFLHQLFTGYDAVSHRSEDRSTVLSTQGNNTSLPSAELGTSPDNAFSVPRPAPYDSDQRLSRLQRDGLFFRREKSSSNFQEESQSLRRTGSSSGMEPLTVGKKWSRVDSDQNLAYTTLHWPEDEDVCPTCLDDYTPENPKIITRCAHHFHLGCIYEWMERSETCPICGKEMEFCESP